MRTRRARHIRSSETTLRHTPHRHVVVTAASAPHEVKLSEPKAAKKSDPSSSSRRDAAGGAAPGALPRHWHEVRVQDPHSADYGEVGRRAMTEWRIIAHHSTS